MAVIVERKAKIVEMLFFGGFTLEEISETLRGFRLHGASRSELRQSLVVSGSGVSGTLKVTKLTRPAL